MKNQNWNSNYQRWWLQRIDWTALKISILWWNNQNWKILWIKTQQWKQ